MHDTDETTNAPPKIMVDLLMAAPLQLGMIELDCAVVRGPDGKAVRVLSTRKFQNALGRTNKKPGPISVQLDRGTQTQAIEIPYFLSAQNLRPFFTETLLRYCTPLWFTTPSGWLASGYRAELLPEVCDLYLSARDKDILHHDQLHIAERCYQLMRAFAKVGIIALVDEVTGFQESREKDELQKLIEHFLGETCGAWVRTFQEQFYQEAFRLHGLRYHPGSRKRPAIIGQFTNRAIYTQILPAPVYAELKTRNPWISRNKRHDLHHQWLTDEIRKNLEHHLGLVLHLMRAASTLQHFWHLMRAGQPRGQLTMAFFDEAFPMIGTAMEGAQEHGRLEGAYK